MITITSKTGKFFFGNLNRVLPSKNVLNSVPDYYKSILLNNFIFWEDKAVCVSVVENGIYIDTLMAPMYLLSDTREDTFSIKDKSKHIVELSPNTFSYIDVIGLVALEDLNMSEQHILCNQLGAIINLDKDQKIGLSSIPKKLNGARYPCPSCGGSGQIVDWDEDGGVSDVWACSDCDWEDHCQSIIYNGILHSVFSVNSDGKEQNLIIEVYL